MKGSTMTLRHRLPLAIAIFLAGALVGAALQARDFRSSDTHGLDYPTVQAVAHMNGLIRERTGGRLGIQVLGQDDQDSEHFTIAQLRNGTLDMARVNLAAFNNSVSSTVILSLPFLFRSRMQMRRVLDGPIGDEILADMEREGLIALCFYDTGARSYYSAKKPIRNVHDMKGLKVRVQASDKSSDMIRAMGAEPMAMPFDRIREALQAGVVDAAADNWPSYITSRHYQVAKYYSLTEHNMAPGVLLFSKKVWDTLSKDDQAIFRAAAKESVPYMRRLWDAYESRERGALTGSDVQIVDNINKKSFSDFLIPLYPKLLPDPRLQAMVKRILADERPSDY